MDPFKNVIWIKIKIGKFINSATNKRYRFPKLVRLIVKKKAIEQGNIFDGSESLVESTLK